MPDVEDRLESKSTLTDKEELLAYCKKYEPEVNLTEDWFRDDFEKIRIFIPKPVYVPPRKPATEGLYPMAQHAALAWEAQGYYLKLYLPRNRSPRMFSGTDSNSLFMVNMHYPLRTLSLYHLGQVGTAQNYENYRGIASYNWAKELRPATFGEADLTILRSARLVGQERLDYVFSEFYVGKKHIPLSFYPDILKLGLSPHVVQGWVHPNIEEIRKKLDEVLAMMPSSGESIWSHLLDDSQAR